MTRNCKRCKKIISSPRIYCATCQTVEDGDDLLGLPIVVDVVSIPNMPEIEFLPAFVADSDGGTAHDTSSSDSGGSDSGGSDGGCGGGDGGGGGGD